jgi:hypothetical protein
MLLLIPAVLIQGLVKSKEMFKQLAMFTVVVLMLVLYPKPNTIA